MLAVHAMSGGLQAVVYFIAFVAAVIAAIVAWVIAPRAIWATLIAVAIACFALVWFVNALAIA